MSKFQKSLYGSNFIPLRTATVKERSEAAVAELGQEVDPELRAIYSWMMDPHVEAFIHSIPAIDSVDDARLEYMHHLQEKNGCFESEARSTRKAKQHADNEGLQTPKKRLEKLRRTYQTPAWYTVYLKTNHWSESVVGVRDGALTYFGRSCVLCGETKRLQVHHRHYRSIGKEDCHDVSVLCETCHKKVTPLLGVCIPRVVPPAALAVLSHEGIEFTDDDQ